MSTAAKNTPFVDLLNRFPLDQLEEERAKVQEQMAQLDTVARLLDYAISARRATDGASTATGPAEAAARPPQIYATPPLRTRVLSIMAEGGPDRHWSPAEIHAALEARNWAPQTAAARSQISNRLRELLAAGQIEKLGKGRYVVKGVPQELPAAPAT